MAETINTQTTGYECVGIEKIEQTYEGLFDNKPNIITIYLTNGDTHQFKVMNGSQGVGIDRIEQRQSSTVSGGRNEFAIILTNGKEYTFSTYNGSGGSGSSGSFNQVLQHLNNLLMPSGKSYLYYNGSGFEWKSPDGSTGGGTADLSEYSWWGRKFDPASKSITGEMSAVTSIEFQSTKGETTIRKKLYLDENGDLCFNGNLYATGGVTALGSGGGTSGGSGGSTTGTLYVGSTSNNLGFDGSKNMNLYFGDGLKVEKSDNQITVSATGGGTGGSLKPLEVVGKNGSDSIFFVYNGETSYRLRFGDGLNMVHDVDEYIVTVTGGSGSGVTLSPVMSQMNKYLTKTTLNTPQFLYWDGTTYTWKDESEISGGSGGSNSRIDTIKLYNSGGEFDSVHLGSANTIGFMAGDNVTLEAIVKDYINVIKISAKGGSSGGSVSWSDVTNKPSTFTPSSHTHSTSDISGLSSYVQGTKVSNADKADRLTNPVTLWGNSFAGNNSIGTSSSHADLRYVKNIYTDSTFDIEANDNSLLKVDSNNKIYIGFGYKINTKASLLLFGNETTILTQGDDYRYDFKKDVFDVNTNTIHFGYEANGGKISWDANNNAFKIEGNVYATGGITALGVSNNATTSNNVDFTFKSVTINGTKQDKVQLTDRGLTFYSQLNILGAYYKKDAIGLYDSANDTCCAIFSFTDSTLTFDPGKYQYDIFFNPGISCSTDENTLDVGTNESIGYIRFYPGSTMTFSHNDKNYSFNVAKAIEQGILTI